MAFIDDSGLSDAERDMARVSCTRDPALEGELELILPVLPRPARTAFWRAFARLAADGRPPAGAVLEALVEAVGDAGG